LCNNAKAAGSTVYTIQCDTSTPADPTSAVLSSCASGTGNFYVSHIGDPNSLWFKSIGTSLTKLHVAKYPGQSEQEKAAKSAGLFDLETCCRC